MNILNRFDRILSILVHLQSGRVVKAQELAERFEVSLRTIYRDIKSLEASGVPISGEAGIGYTLIEGYRLPPVMFTREESDSFVAAEKLMQKFSDKNMKASFESGMFKLKSQLRGSAKDRLTILESQIYINSGQKLFHENTPDALNVLLDSIAEKKQVALQYQSLYADKLIDRIIEPVGLFNENNYWYVMAYCLLRSDYRQFRTDRMLQIKRTDISFTKQHGNVEDYRKCNILPGKIKVVILFNREISRYILHDRNYYGFVSEKIVGDKVEMTFLTNDIQNGLPRWFLMFGDYAQILEPVTLKKRVEELLEILRLNLENTQN